MIRVRRSRPSDCKRALENWRAAIDATHDFLSAEDRYSIDEEAQRFLPDMPPRLAVDDDDIAVAFSPPIHPADRLYLHAALL